MLFVIGLNTTQQSFKLSGMNISCQGGTTEPPKLITWGSVSQMGDPERKSNTREQWKSSNSRIYSKYIIPLGKQKKIFLKKIKKISKMKLNL